MSSISERREHIHGMWAGVAAGWADHADAVEERGAAVNAVLLERLGLARGARVLELACGPGGGGIAAARAVGPTGHVVLTDVVQAMATVAGERAAAQGLTNVSTAVRDIEAIAEPDASFDAVLCREGLMFAVEPGRAAAEIHRVLRPGGRAGIAVWGPQRANPWLGLVFEGITAVTGQTLPPPGLPGPFALDDADRLGAVLSAGGLVDIAIDELDAPLQAGSYAAWWERTSALAGPLTTILGMFSPETRRALDEHLRSAVAPFTHADGSLTIPGCTLIACARRPG